MISEKGSFGLFGASRVGIALAYHFHRAGYLPEFVWNRSEEGLNKALRWVPFKYESTSIKDFQGKSNWIIISVSDDAIESIAQKLADSVDNLNNVNAFHTSGFLCSEVLNPLKEKGCRTGSFHPVLSVPDIKTGIREMPSAVFTCEGEIDKELMKLAEKIGRKGVILTPEQKKLVHVSSVFLSNYSVSLIAAVKELCEKKGLSEDKATMILKGLSEQAVENGWSKPLAGALTGPIVRGDVKTIEKHLEFLDSYPELKELYANFGILTINIIPNKKNHTFSKIILDIFRNSTQNFGLK